MQFEYSIGNLKIGKDTLIFNMGSATNCSAGKLGLCEFFRVNSCYAYKAEVHRREPLPFRNRQEAYWLASDAITIAEDIAKVFAKKLKTKLKYVRINEAGDLHSTDCIAKLIQIATLLPTIKFYTYTHRSDLIASDIKLPKNLTINCSNFTCEGFNSFTVDKSVTTRSLKKEIGALTTKLKDIHGKDALVCKGDCSKCKLCTHTHGKTIWVPLH